MKHFLLFIGLIVSYFVGFGQTPNNCGNYTSTGSNSSSYLPGSNAGCNSNVPGTVTGTGAWTGSSCGGTIVSTVVGPPVSCITVSYTAVNTNDYGTLSTNTGGVLTITGVNVGVSGNVIGPYQCVGGTGGYGDVLVTICSTIPFNSLTLTNTGCSSGWVINCATPSCSAAWTAPTPCSDDPPVDLSALITGDAGGTFSGTGITGNMFDPAVGTQSITYTAPGGCSVTNTITVTPAGNPAWTIPTNICQNDPPIDLSAFITGTAGGTWSGTGISGTMFDPSVGTQSITYDVGTAPCNNTSAQTITVTPSLSPAWSSPGSICESAGSINLDALVTGDLGGTWSGAGVTGSTFNPTGLSGAIPISYTIGSSPCVATVTNDITVIPDVDPTWVAPTTLCDSDGPFDLNTAITGTTGGTWSGTGVTGNNFDPSFGTQNITYTVGTAPCQEILTLPINVGVTPDPSWTVFTVCLDDPPVDLDTTITGDTGGTWSGTGIAPPGNTFYPTVGPQNITYTVTSGNCTASSTQTITGLNPGITLTNTNATCYGLNDGSVSVTAGGGSGNYSYSWNTNPTQTTTSVSNLPAGTYTVTVIDLDANCVNIDSITIIQPSQVTLSLTGYNACTPLLGQATAFASGGVGGFTYAWNDTINTTSNAISLDSGYHAVTVTDANGCTATDSILIQIFPTPIVTLTPNTTIEWGDFIQLNATGGVTYNWTPSDYLECDDCPDPVAAPVHDTQYCVNIVNSDGCVLDTCVTITVVLVCHEVFVPSAFSPNDDGENDMLCVYSDCWDHLTFNVYNRWGEKVFSSESESVCWDGTWNGKPLNPAVFVYTVDGYLLNGELISQKGNISLIR
ncbi:MAG: gliding motility-associated C-terminal domain-containing protein [Crocinitomicaceae bacterium]|nr:gliding motility-associated C-terminal domain-containing protein [Crocinitomicaceae bacterium]